MDRSFAELTKLPCLTKHGEAVQVHSWHLGGGEGGSGFGRGLGPTPQAGTGLALAMPSRPESSATRIGLSRVSAAWIDEAFPWFSWRPS